MSEFKHKPNSGSLFKNDRRETETQPHAKGSALIDGVEYWVSAWTNDGKKGKYQSLKFQRKDEFVPNTQSAQNRPKAAPVEDESSDEIPF